MTTATVDSQQSQLVNAFAESTLHVFSTIMGAEIELADCCTLGKFQTANDLSGMVGFSGEITGTVIVRLDQQIAIAMAEVLLGQTIQSEDDDVRDMAGEIASQIAGNAKNRLTEKSVTLSLPTIITGPGHRISFEPGAQVQRLCFQSQWGPLCVELGFRV